ncbi:hypothetical protein Q760_05920 [Cellulomonas cellasea DSM 20118]|uniref:DUF2178 domain-containing protein n=3 Tax=Cellulomonas cellasea TaxID=43670 RepID=A0A0A0B3N5_9CELL|nr:hypothetical protein Q760_05920 [Cellulomonas cellasea DSM 20118]GEA86650.1 hypothetical protein CCE01nite_05990 [Cellulomonas cellasea]
MSFEEKGAWLYLGAAVVTYVGYVVALLVRAGGAPPADAPWVSTMLGAIAASVVLSVVGQVVLGVARPSEAHQKDVRDEEINRRGEFVGGVTLGVAMVVPFALTLLEQPHVWVANAMYLAFTLAAVVGSAAKLVAYRRGFR